MTLTLDDIGEAADRIAPYVHETPMLRMQNLDAFFRVPGVFENGEHAGDECV